jgi:RHS repeat-associated protein
VSKLTYGGTGNTRTFTYDDLHRRTGDELKTPGGTSIAKIAYGWDANGNETSKTTTNFNGTTTANTYSYDLANRLTGWNNGTTNTAYGYDKSGNRVQAGSKTFAYDTQNRLINDSLSTYTYTARGTLSSTTTGSIARSTTADAFGQILSQDSAAGTQTYTYDGLGRVIKPGFAYTGLGNMLAGDGTTTYVRDPAGTLLGEQAGADTKLAWTDLHTDVVGQFTPTGTTLAGSTTYDPLGKVIATTAMIGSLGYQSEWTDAFTGRVNMLARWYNTETGQFDSRDSYSNNPVPASVGANRFQYGDANPMTVTDPSGHCSWYDVVCKGKAAVSTVSSYASSAWNYGTNTLSSAYHSAVSWGESRLSEGMGRFSRFADGMGMHGLAKAADKGRKQLAAKAAHHKHEAKKHAEKARQAGHALKVKVQRAVSKVVKNVKDAAHATVKWAKDHKAEIAGFAVGLVVGGLCGAAIGWTGVGAVACGALAGAAGSLVTGAMKGDTGWDLVKDVGVGALFGAAGGALGSMAGQAIGAGFRAVAGGAGSKVFSGAGKAFAEEGANIFGGLRNAGTSLVSKASAGIGRFGTSAMAAGKSQAESVLKNGIPTLYKATQTVFGADRATMQNATALVNDGLHDVIVHGGRNGMAIVEGASVNPGQIAELVSGNPGYTAGQACRLLVCHAGQSGLAQDVANALGAPVRGATDVVRAMTGGGTEVGNGGYWRTFLPITSK